MAPAAGQIRFLLDGEVHLVSGLPATTSLLDYLREHLDRRGTKEGCAEGDCGACTVVIGELQGDALRYRPINSCIRFLPTLDGKELITVESLQAPDGRLHPVQQALVDCHASQCGFCTPGFVMSLFALYLRSPAPQREEVLDALSGNLCRCTGYRPIIDAAECMGRYPEPEHWSRVAAQHPAKLKSFDEISRDPDSALEWPGFYAPRTLNQLAARLLEHRTGSRRSESLILAGATDIGLWVTKELRELPTLVYLGEVTELQQIRSTVEGLEIGAAVTLVDAWQSICQRYPSLTELAQRFASLPVCSSGTLIGNLANGSPIGDSMPPLIALGSILTLQRGDVVRRVTLEAFYLGYQKKDLQAGEFVVSVTIPPLETGELLACYKVSKRHDQDISAVCAAIRLKVADGLIEDLRLVYGGMAALPSRAPRAEAALRGRPFSAASFEAAAQAIAQDFQPLSDFRASASYRLQVAGNLLRRFYLESSADVVGAELLRDRPFRVMQVAVKNRSHNR